MFNKRRTGAPYQAVIANQSNFINRGPLGWLSPFLLFSAGALNSYSITLLGKLTVGEIVILGTFFFVVALSPVKVRGVAIIGGFLTLYLGSAIVTDIIRQTVFEDYARGWAKLLILGVGIIWLLKASRMDWYLLRFFFAGLATAPLVNYAIGSSTELGFWKFTLGPSLTMFLGFWSTFTSKRTIEGRIAWLYLALGIFHFFENSRSLGLLTLFTGLILIYGSAKIQRLLAGKNMLTVIFGAIILAVFGYALLKSYEFAAAKGFLGAAAEDKYREQSEKTNNLISAARGEYVASWAAIADSPLIGHGSWAKNTKYIEIFLAGQGINLSSSEARSFMQTEFIPTHSHIFGAWVEAGILGAVFWAYIAFLAVRVLVRVLRPEWAVYRPLVIYLTLTILFDIAFSPFGLERRMTDAAIITGFIIILNRGAGGSTEGRAGMQYFLRPSEVQGVLPFRRAPVHEVCPDARRPNRL